VVVAGVCQAVGGFREDGSLCGVLVVDDGSATIEAADR
jgi:hypothetical protein